MLMPIPGQLSHLRSRIMPVLTGPAMLAFLPALTLGAFWLGGEPALVIVSLTLPLIYAIGGVLGLTRRGATMPRDNLTGLMLRDGFEALVDDIFQ